MPHLTVQCAGVVELAADRIFLAKPVGVEPLFYLGEGASPTHARVILEDVVGVQGAPGQQTGNTRTDGQFGNGRRTSVFGDTNAAMNQERTVAPWTTVRR